MADPLPLLAIGGLRVAFTARGRRVEAVHDVSLTVGAGEVVALVGESGSGKTTIARAVMGMLPDTATIEAGSVVFEGETLTGNESRFDRIRGRRIGWIPQDPMCSIRCTASDGRSPSR